MSLFEWASAWAPLWWCARSSVERTVWPGPRASPVAVADRRRCLRAGAGADLGRRDPAWAHMGPQAGARRQTTCADSRAHASAPIRSTQLGKAAPSGAIVRRPALMAESRVSPNNRFTQPIA